MKAVLQDCNCWLTAGGCTLPELPPGSTVGGAADNCNWRRGLGAVPGMQMTAAAVHAAGRRCVLPKAVTFA